MESTTQAGAPRLHRGKLFVVTLTAALGGLPFGFDTSVINGAVNSIQHEFQPGSAAVGFTVAITLIGCAIGAWFAGQLELCGAVNRSWCLPRFCSLSARSDRDSRSLTGN